MNGNLLIILNNMPQLKKQIFILEKDGHNAQKTIGIERDEADSIKLEVSIKGKPIHNITFSISEYEKFIKVLTDCKYIYNAHNVLNNIKCKKIF